MSKELRSTDHVFEPSNRELFIALALNGVWTTAPVSQVPEIALGSWSIRQLSNGDRHFVGRNLTKGTGRVSSKIEVFDAETGRGVTDSGRIYELSGRPGHDDDAEYVWTRWCAINAVSAWIDVSKDLVLLEGFNR